MGVTVGVAGAPSATNAATLYWLLLATATAPSSLLLQQHWYRQTPPAIPAELPPVAALRACVCVVSTQVETTQVTQ